MNNPRQEKTKTTGETSIFTSENSVYLIGRIIKTWASANMMELTWTGMHISKQGVDPLIRNILNNIHQNGVETESFGSIKKEVTGQASFMLQKEFEIFIGLLKDNDARAWSELVSVFKIRSASWISRRINDHEHISQVFSDALVVLYNDLVSGKKVHFSNSRDLKSYLYKILEFKIKEHKRSVRKQETTFSENKYPDALQFQDYEEEYPENSRLKYIEDSIMQLDADEQKILHDYYFSGKKLKKIATELHLTQENVRIKKHRALKSIINGLNKEGYEAF